MKRKTQSLMAGLLSMLMVSAPAFAQPGPGHDRNGPQRGHERHDQHMQGPGHHNPSRPQVRPAPRGPQVVVYPEYRRFNRGDRLPPQYRQPQYVVNDWRGHGLRQPPRGYHWVQNGSDYVLVAIATGVISAVVINALTGR
ncbi:MAG: RcnB family protein [Ottowia sp.]|uniref:RcnB family protein n=1 Tax=Ottowia sp. TaxID=1898956 RepID=UPI003C75694F